MITANGPEKNTIQWAEDGINFEVKSHIILPPDVAGLFFKDKYTNTSNGQGFGEFHILHNLNQNPGVYDSPM